MATSGAAIQLNEKTTIPIWAVIVAIPTFVALISWVSSVANTTNANAKAVEDVQKNIGSIHETVIHQNEKVIDRLGRIEEQIKYLNNSGPDRN